MANTRRRCLVGLIFGTALGLTYGLVSQMVNHILAPGIPLYQPPLGALGNVLLCALGGALLGAVSAWPSSSVIGAFLAGVTGALMIEASVWLTGEAGSRMLLGKTMAAIAIFLPVTAALVLPISIFRWAVNKQEEALVDSWPIWKRVWLPLGLLILVGGVGAYGLYPQDARAILLRMNVMLQAGQHAADAASLPPALQVPEVEGFLENAKGPFTLEWTKSDLNRFAIPYPMTSDPWSHSVVVARFGNDWTLACLFIAVEAEPRCKHYVKLVLPDE